MRPLVYTALLLAACAPAERPAPSADTAAGQSATPPAAAGRDSATFHAERAHDFAGDGRPFTIVVDARGPTADSMRVALRITRGDTIFHRADWTTAHYAKYDAAPPGADSTRRRVEAHLARLLADSAFRTTRAFLGPASDVDATLRDAIAFDVRVDAERRARGLTPADTLPLDAAASPRAADDPARVRALVAELRDAPAFRYHTGGEASYVVAWSRAERRFVIAFQCC